MAAAGGAVEEAAAVVEEEEEEVVSVSFLYHSESVLFAVVILITCFSFNRTWPVAWICSEATRVEATTKQRLFLFNLDINRKTP